MFWKREQEIRNGELGPLIMPTDPPKKEFKTMLEMLKDAEKYDNAGELDVSKSTLTALCKYIEKYKEGIIS